MRKREVRSEPFANFNDVISWSWWTVDAPIYPREQITIRIEWRATTSRVRRRDIAISTAPGTRVLIRKLSLDAVGDSDGSGSPNMQYAETLVFYSTPISPSEG